MEGKPDSGNKMKVFPILLFFPYFEGKAEASVIEMRRHSMGSDAIEAAFENGELVKVSRENGPALIFKHESLRLLCLDYFLNTS